MWFDRYNITPDVPEHKETLESIGNEMKILINKIVESGVSPNRIVIGTYFVFIQFISVLYVL